MSQNQYQGGFTVHRLRSGVTTQLSLSVTGGLYVILDSDNVIQSPSWKTNGPVITPSVSNGTISNPKWYVDMPEETTGAARNAYDITTVFSGKCSVSASGVLTFTDDVINTSNIHNIKLTFICDVVAGDINTSDIKRSIMILVNKGNGTSYWGNILTERTTLTETNTSTIMTPVLWQGAKDKTHGTHYHVLWTKTDANGNDVVVAGDGETATTGYTFDGVTGALTVTRDCVDGIANYECHFVNKDDHTLEYEVEGVRIADESDPYEVVTYGTDWVESSSTIVVNAFLRNKVTNANYGTGTGEKIKWTVAVTDKIRYRNIPLSECGGSFSEAQQSSATPKFTMSAQYMRLPMKPNDDGSWNGWAVQGDDADHDTKVTGDNPHLRATECEIEIYFTAEI